MERTLYHKEFVSPRCGEVGENMKKEEIVSEVKRSLEIEGNSILELLSNLDFVVVDELTRRFGNCAGRIVFRITEYKRNAIVQSLHLLFTCPERGIP